MNYLYSIYSLTIAVPFPCPMLNLAPPDTEPDITVFEGLVPRTLPMPAMEERAWQVAPDVYL